jgi:4,5-DOPA dioxygenase extradiol
VLTLQAHRDYGAAVPTPDHFVPMLYLAALAEAAGDTPHVLVDGYAHGSMSMTAYTLGVTCPHDQSRADVGAVPMPGSDLMPADESNI